MGFKVKCAKDGITKSDIYNKISPHKGLSSFDSVYIVQEYPNAKNKELLKHYYIKFYGNASKASLSSLLLETKLFTSVEEEEIFFIEECGNPVSINESIITNGILNNKALELLDAECAWSISRGDPSIIIGIADTDFDTTQEDLKNQIVSLVGPITDRHYHGTVVSGCAAAETNNGVGIAGIAYNCKLAAHRVSHTVTESGSASSNGDLGTAIWNLYQAGCPIISVSWNGTGLNVDAVREITESGTLLVVSAGGSPNAQNNRSIADIPGVINVSGVDSNNFHGPTGHAHNEFVDVCVMSKDVAVCSTGNTYRTSTGTSPANPQVAGVAALMLSINRNLTPAQIETIIKETADSINDAHLFPNQLGAGRVNAYSALLKTIDFDLYTKDSERDNGVEPYTYTQYGYNSPDIWVRRSKDGGTEHQSAFNGGKNYVYVRIHNRGSVPSTGNEKLLLYRKLASPNSGYWPNSWTIASQDTLIIPSIQPNSSIIVCYEVNFPFDPLHNREYSLLTRIISEWDTISTETSNTIPLDELIYSMFNKTDRFAR